jgi:hypothetical protein
MAITLDTHNGADSGPTAVTNQTVTLTVTAGDLIVAAVSVGNDQTSNLTVSDNVNSGNYTQALSPDYDSTLGQTGGIWYYTNSASGSITVKAALTSGSASYFALTVACFKGASTSTSGVLGPANTASGSTANASGTSVTPAQNGALIFSASQMISTAVSGPGSGFNLLDNESTYTLLADEYVVQTTAASISATWSNSAQAWVVQTAVFYPPSGTVTMDWSSPEEMHAKASYVGFSYDDDTQFNSVVPPIPKQFEQDCDTTSRNFDFNCAAQQWVEGEQPPPLPRIFGNPFEWDGADIARNIDFFLAQQQLIDQEPATPQTNFAPITDWTLSADDASQKNWDVDSAADQLPDPDDKPPQNYFPTMDWTADHDWTKSCDARVVEDEDERELAWPIPAGAPLLNLGWDQDAIESRWFQGSADPGVGSAALVDEPAARPFAPTADWTADYDWQHSTDARVVEDEDERELVWPIPIFQILNLGWDQDGLESRCFGSAWSVDQDDSLSQPFSPVMDWTQEADCQRPFASLVGIEQSTIDDRQSTIPTAPTLAWDEVDWQRWIDSRVALIDDDRSMELIAAAIAQTIAMAVQQMRCLPLLGLQLMAALPLMLSQGTQAAPAEELGLDEVRVDV